MNKILFLILLTTIALGTWFFWSQYKASEFTLNVSDTIEVVSGTEMDEALNSTTPGMQTYTNEEWGFQFEIPEDWEVLEGAFRGYYTQEGIWLRAPADREGDWDTAAVIHIVDPDFIEASFGNLYDKKEFALVDGIQGIKYTYNWKGKEQLAIVIPVQKYSMILGSKGNYPAEFQEFLETFQFLDHE